MESLRGVLARRLAGNADALEGMLEKTEVCGKVYSRRMSNKIVQETPDCSSTAAETLRLTRTWDYCRCCKHYLQISKVNSIFSPALRRASVRSLTGRDQISASL
jgi:hypothetical protein